ncbi:MAG: hypothetical protein J5970_05075 [Bacilli bacterium]|nr:hypothetical protein [Bacilli bacterium]
MKKVKVLVLLIGILLLCGCSGNYNVNINEDLSVNEELNLKIKQGEKVYENTLKLFDDNDISPKKYKVVAANDVVTIKYKEKYDSLEEYLLDSKIYKNLFDTVNYNNNRNKIDISSTAYFITNNTDSEYIIDDLDISLLKINVKTPYEVFNDNADSKVKEVSTWNIKKEMKTKSIKFSLDINKNKSAKYQILMIVLILGIVVFSAAYLVYTIINRQKIK